jgi:hypothetical protein
MCLKRGSMTCRCRLLGGIHFFNILDAKSCKLWSETLEGPSCTRRPRAAVADQRDACLELLRKHHKAPGCSIEDVGNHRSDGDVRGERRGTDGEREGTNQRPHYGRGGESAYLHADCAHDCAGDQIGASCCAAAQMVSDGLYLQERGCAVQRTVRPRSCRVVL